MKSFKMSLCIVVGIGILASVSWATPTKIPVWTSDKSISEQLAPAVTIGKYQIQPPKGYISLHTLSGPSDSSIDASAGLTRPDGTRPYIMLGHFPIPKGQESKYTLKQISDKMLGAIERHRKDWKESPTEQGTVNGVTFFADLLARNGYRERTTYAWLQLCGKR